VLFATTSFVPLARSIALANGLQDLRMVVVDHPLGGIGESALEGRIDAAFEQLVAVLEESSEQATPASDDGTPQAAGEAPDGDLAESVRATLEELRSSLANDGAGLQVVPASDGGIAVELTFTDQACMDCVVPPAILKSIILDTLQRTGLKQGVTVLDPRSG
jgi:Fe-S cluster biogenesis protein NfuA